MIYSLRNKKSASGTVARLRHQRGFTLIELLVVIAIIGVLATVVLASLNNARRKSRDARRVTDLKQIALALELYFDGVGRNQYPVGTGTCTAVPGSPPAADENYNLQPLVTDGYIASIPRDPSDTARCYLYRSATISALTTTYHLAAILEDNTNQALNSDKDCTDAANGAAPDCLPASPVATWNGSAAINGVRSATSDCTGAVAAASTVDNCFDVMP